MTNEELSEIERLASRYIERYKVTGPSWITWLLRQVPVLVAEIRLSRALVTELESEPADGVDKRDFIEWRLAQERIRKDGGV